MGRRAISLLAHRPHLMTRFSNYGEQCARWMRAVRNGPSSHFEKREKSEYLLVRVDLRKTPPLR